MPLHGGLTAWIRGDSRMVAATPEFAMSERDHGATDGLHLEDAGGRGESGEWESQSSRVYITFKRSASLETVLIIA